MKKKVLEYCEFLEMYYEECKSEDWFPEVLTSCYDLEVDDLTVSAIIGEIHEGLRVNYDEAIKYFWTIMLINPLIAIKAYQETDLLLGNVDINGLFSELSKINPFSKKNITYDELDNISMNTSGIYNPSIENYMIFAIEALLQKDMNPEKLQMINNVYLMGLYNHDKAIMGRNFKHKDTGDEIPAKWITHRNLSHILNATDPRHLIILLEFFADRYGARLRKGNIIGNTYSGDKYNYIIAFIKRKYGSLSEYIEWENHSYNYHYMNYYRRSLFYEELYRNNDVIFPTKEDKSKIEMLCGIGVKDYNYYKSKRSENRVLSGV